MFWILASGLVDRIKALYDTLHTFRADIVQEVKFGNVERYYGRVYLKKPSLFRWELTRPTEYIIVARGDSSWVKYEGEIYSQPVPYDLKSLLMGDYSSLNVEERKSSEGYVLKITTDRTGYDSLLVFLRKDLLPVRIVAYNENNYVDIRFSNIAVNVSIPDSLFRLSVP
ncbi:MAG: outer membrane lipoprotein carrier protein LolA [Thermotogae bacterium]|nr:outer membrane lipoprotein carrier protein LolA [Thermotogota bacterium]